MFAWTATFALPYVTQGHSVICVTPTQLFLKASQEVQEAVWEAVS